MPGIPDIGAGTYWVVVVGAHLYLTILVLLGSEYSCSKSWALY